MWFCQQKDINQKTVNNICSYRARASSFVPPAVFYEDFVYQRFQKKWLHFIKKIYKFKVLVKCY